jgi:ubiquinone/menaquinone biosynthesis C-methylase UbiE
MTLSVRLQRWYLGLHGLGLLREWPFGDPAEADARIDAMRRLLDGEGDAETFEDRRIDDLDVADAYRAWSETYDEPNPLITVEESALRALLGELPTGRAIDVASGTGRIATELRRLGHAVIASDRSDAMLMAGRSRPDPVPAVMVDMTRLPFADACADLVVCGLALTHVEDLAPVFEGFARVVAPGGAIVTSDIHPMAAATGAHAFFKRADGTRGVTRNHVHWPSAYVTAAASAGLVVRRCAEAFVDDALLRDLGVDDLYLSPEAAIEGLPFALLWSFERPA